MTVQDVGEWNNFYMVVKGVIDDDGLRKDFFPNAVASLQKFPGEVAGSFLGPLIDKK